METLVMFSNATIFVLGVYIGGSSGLITDNFKFIVNAFICTGTALYLLADVRYDIFSD